MNLKIVAIAFILSAATLVRLSSQTFVRPNIAMKIPETLELLKAELTSEKTVLFMSVENRIAGGNFCADKNIFLVYPDGEKLKISEASGIPVCPDTYSFKTIGEKLFFALVFPPLKPGTSWIDIVEECTPNCFRIYGITLDTELNRRLDDAFKTASGGKPEDNILLFRDILNDIDSRNAGIEGLLYVNIINAATEAGDRVEASVWYKRLLSSGAPRVSHYIKFLNDRGIRY